MRPGLILCDMRRPQLDDFSILKHVKNTPEYRAIPFLIFSGHSEKKDMQEAIALGADDYLVMPFEMRDLLKMIRHHMKSAQKEVLIDKGLAAIQQFRKKQPIKNIKTTLSKTA